jgi:lysophospholipase L1-like esterase
MTAVRGRIGAVAARLALVLGSTALALGGAEGAYRLQNAAEPAPPDDPAWRARVRERNGTLYQRSEDPVLVYEPRPGASVRASYGAAGFNRAGMRDDRDHARDPPADRRRVAILGDSIAWSEEVALEASLGRAVERALGGEARAEVLAFGVSGYDTVQEARWYERAVRPYRPAALVLVYCLNDAMIASGPYNRFATPEELARKEAQDALWDRLAPLRAETLDTLAAADERAARLRILSRARWWLLGRRYQESDAYTDEILLSHAQPDRAERVRAALLALGAALRADGVDAHLVISPVLKAWERYPWASVHAQVAAWARAAGFAVHDPLPEWRRTERPEALRLPGDPLHYGPAGNERLGRFIAAALAPQR